MYNAAFAAVNDGIVGCSVFGTRLDDLRSVGLGCLSVSKKAE